MDVNSKTFNRLSRLISAYLALPSFTSFTYFCLFHLAFSAPLCATLRHSCATLHHICAISAPLCAISASYCATLRHNRLPRWEISANSRDSSIGLSAHFLPGEIPDFKRVGGILPPLPPQAARSSRPEFDPRGGAMPGNPPPGAVIASGPNHRISRPPKHQPRLGFRVKLLLPSRPSCQRMPRR